MEQLQEAIRQLTGALNAQIEQSMKLERRLHILENPVKPAVETALYLVTPKSAEDLKEISKLPDCVKELQPFDGNPTQYISWIHSVESILKDYSIMRDRPIYRAILQSVRQKIRGKADSALISYNIFDDEWTAIKKCLSLHYADKRDLRTLEHQLSNLSQRNMTLDEFYANVNHQFSLVVNKIKTEEYSADTVSVLIETYRNRALDVFIRGLNGDLSKILIIQKPQTLPEAYASCLEIQNLNFRNLSIHKKNTNNSVTAPINQIFSRPNFNPPDFQRMHNQMTLPQRNMAYNSRSHNQMTLPQRNMAYNIQHENIKVPPRPTHPKPPEPMDIDPSLQSRRINYMNRPPQQAQQSQQAFKKDNSYYNEPRRQQRVYHIETQEGKDNDEYSRCLREEADIEEFEDEEEIEENAELNFMTDASLAFHT